MYLAMSQDTPTQTPMVLTKTIVTDLLYPRLLYNCRKRKLLKELSTNGCNRYNEKEMWPKNLKSLRLIIRCSTGEMTNDNTRK